MILAQIIAFLGLTLIIIGTSLISSKREIRRKYTYPLLIIGGIFLTIYSVYLKDIVFIILQIFFVISSILGLIRINEKYSKEVKQPKK
jgi:lipid-A-disaccharide synthase-like uncharacterized protein